MTAMVLSAACASGSTARLGSTVHVAPPMGDSTADRRSLAEAFATAEPGDTIAFASGTYRIGGEGLELATSDVLLLGSPEGTVLRGVDPGRLQQLGEEEFFRFGNGLRLSGGRQSVQGITFEHFGMALAIGGAGGASANRQGGHELVGNHFRDSVTLQIEVDADLPTVVRGNRFTNTYHAVAALGRNVHVLDNDISAPDPQRVPFGWPSLAIGIRPLPGVPCLGHRVFGNRIEGHTDAVGVGVFPPDGAGARIGDLAIRDNTIQMHPVYHSESAGVALAGTPAIGVAIRLINAQRAVARGELDFPFRPADGWPSAFAEAAITGVAITGNRIDGAIGVAIELVEADGNVVTGNRIGPVAPVASTDVARLREHATFGVGPGSWLRQNALAANGTAIWLSPGSVGNLIEPGAVEGR